MADMRPPSPTAGDYASDKRRTQRVQIAMPIIVRGQTGAQKFEEETNTVTVNVHGGLLLLKTPVNRMQKLSIVNPKTTEEMPCTVVFVGQKESGKTQIGIEFDEPSRLFWKISFPPDDWDPAQRKRPGQLPTPTTPKPK
jgi:hypothetical protein